MEASMRFAVILAALLLVMPTAIRSDAANVHNGVWWNQLSTTERLFFLEGYIDGLARADFLLTQNLKVRKQKLPDVSTNEEVTSFFKFYKITYGQFMEGLNTFYADYRNPQINFDVAILYIRDQIHGTSQKDLDLRLEDMRKATTSPDYDDH
jgi:hypothetical protein